MGGKKFKLLSDHITWDVATDRYNALRTEYYEMSKVAIAEVDLSPSQYDIFSNVLSWKPANIFIKSSASSCVKI